MNVGAGFGAGATTGVGTELEGSEAARIVAGMTGESGRPKESSKSESETRSGISNGLKSVLIQSLPGGSRVGERF
jgi:hypothetical protein